MTSVSGSRSNLRVRRKVAEVRTAGDKTTTTDDQRPRRNKSGTHRECRFLRTAGKGHYVENPVSVSSRVQYLAFKSSLR